MKHRIPVESLGPRGPAMANAVEACVHCGFCLAACPTYLTFGQEMDSPRGRIVLMKGALEGDLPLEQVLPHVDRCLGCMGCVPACPSGVQYGDLLTSFREFSENRRKRPLLDRLIRALAVETLPHPRRLRVAIFLAKPARPLRRFLPAPFRAMLDLVPERVPSWSPLPAIHPAQGGTRRARVALLAGCAQQVLAPEINRATLRVLARNGVEVVIPPDQGCCGALPLHTGATERARTLARVNLRAFDLTDLDAVVTNSAGCGSGMHDYPLLFAGTDEASRARAFSERVQDVSTFLDELGIVPPPLASNPCTVAYHDACHLAHAQGVVGAPRRLLESVPGLDLVPIPEGEICCGSAGTYNLEQPETGAKLGSRKADAILGTGAELVVTGNIGCIVQIRSHLDRKGSHLPVKHTMELLDSAYGGVEGMA